MKKFYLFLTLLLCSSVILNSQCAQQQTFTVCDMTVVDNDSNGTPDGIINLYDELSIITGTTITTADGMFFDPNFNFALDVGTGDLYLWDLPNSSENETDYQFEFLDSASGCPDDVSYLFNIVLGPYSGTAASTTSGGVNLQVCQEDTLTECDDTFAFDLFQTFISNPSPHTNGTWSYLGGGDFLADLDEDTGIAQTEIPYSAGPPLVDEQTYNFRYTVPGISPCDPEQFTDVVVTVVREPFSGFADEVLVCETELIDGSLGIIDLSSNDYLIGEDIEGIWVDASGTGQISNPGDSSIDFNEIYQDLVATNPRFGQQTYEFDYFVESRSGVCESSTSTVSFTVGEYIRPFAQTADEQLFCIDDEAVTSINLYDFIEFTTENGVLFDYPNNGCTDWRYISGPAPTNTDTALGLVNNAFTTNGLTGACQASAGYTSRGTLDLSNLTPEDIGTYTFRYSVLGSYNGVGDSVNYSNGLECDGAQTLTNQTICPGESTLVTITIVGAEYPGVDTAGIVFCESVENLVLTDLLETDGIQTVYTGPNAFWTDTATGDTVDNNFVIPEITADSQVFNFEYTTTSVDGCAPDTATLEFTIFRQFDPGESGPLVVCSDAGEVDLFTLLTGTPDDNGTWTGPEGYVSDTNVALFDPAVNVEGEYIYTVPENSTCPGAQATVTVSLGDADYAGEDTADIEFCESETSVDLFTLLTTNGTDEITEGGEFSDPFGSPVTNPFVFPTDIPEDQSFSFIYTTPGTTGCQEQATLSFIVFEQYTAGTGGSTEICTDAAAIDLFTLLTDTPDTNGTWSGPDGFTTADNSAIFDPEINAAGDYIYTVPVNGSCEADTATVTVTFFDVAYAGEDTVDVELCEILTSVDLTSLLETNGTDTIVTDGSWTDTFGTAVANPFVFPSNIPEEQSFSFIYTTTSTDGCQDEAVLSFIIFEQFNAGTGVTTEVCPDSASFSLFDLLTDAPDTEGMWSGPDGFATTDNNAIFDPETNSAGAYVYTVPVNGTCEADTATITVNFLAIDYAGEDTTGVEVCDTAETVDLISLLETDGTSTIVTDGIWTDATGTIQANTFTIPTIDSQEVFEFTYSTSNASGCNDEATLSFTVFEQNDAGEGTTVAYCINEGIVNLFNELTNSPDNNGTWTGPEGYTATGTAAVLDLSTAVDGDYVYTIASNGACEEVSATVSITISELSNAGDDVNTFLCPGDYIATLSDLLDDDATLGGDFIDLATSLEVPDGTVDVATIGVGTFSYLYVVNNGACPEDDATITFTITAIAAPTVSDIADFYCINDGITLDDLTVDGADEFAWFAFAEAGEELPLSTLLVDGQTYFVAAVDDNECESIRVSYTASVRPLSDGSCNIGISNGVSDNDDGLNDSLDLGSLPDVFPNFDIQIFNRYGTIVYRGNRDTPLFDGSSNTGSGLGDQLPTGVYFYIFYPNDNNSAPIDGTFYLSR